MSRTCLCLPSRSWYSFTDPGGMLGLSGPHYYAALLLGGAAYCVALCVSVCLSVRPVIITERHFAPPSELQ